MSVFIYLSIGRFSSDIWTRLCDCLQNYQNKEANKWQFKHQMIFPQSDSLRTNSLRNYILTFPVYRRESSKRPEIPRRLNTAMQMCEWTSQLTSRKLAIKYPQPEFYLLESFLSSMNTLNHRAIVDSPIVVQISKFCLRFLIESFYFSVGHKPRLSKRHHIIWNC